MILSIDTDYVDLKLRGTFRDKINILFGPSGSGKTFLFSRLKVLFTDNGTPFVEIPQGADASLVKQLVELVKPGTVILYDRGDLTFTEDICADIDSKDVTCIISLKTLKNAMRGHCGLYDVEYTPGEITVEEV